MDCITLMRTVRRVEREAARRGLNGDALAKETFIPDTGTYQQQLMMADIWADVGEPMSTRDGETVYRLIRNCVLTSKPRPPRINSRAKMAREWQRGRR